jgi:hypothetical protein
VGDTILKSNMTRRVDFAVFMVEALENDELVHEAPAIVGRQKPSALAHPATRSACRSVPRVEWLLRSLPVLGKDFKPETLIADMGYDFGGLYDACEARGIRPIVPLRATPAVKRGDHHALVCEHGRRTFAGADFKRCASKLALPEARSASEGAGGGDRATGKPAARQRKSRAMSRGHLSACPARRQSPVSPRRPRGLTSFGDKRRVGVGGICGTRACAVALAEGGRVYSLHWFR